jgi:RES domain-containing protein
VITAWRIVIGEYAESAFDGEGARINGGRWNSQGLKVVYTSSSAALAALELLVRIRKKEPLRKYVLFACTFGENLVETVERNQLPDDWRLSPPLIQLQQIGDSWVHSAASAVLQVPSAIIENESNFLLNPEHPDFKKIDIADPTPFSLDVRLLPH